MLIINNVGDSTQNNILTWSLKSFISKYPHEYHTKEII